ncbi:hypothetical protein CLHUN_40790 [Ruminiclostridium hungatei]|uniref:ESAT-6-like protein n=1 Tax=Ruminiclostridium hungatei TaxID=48256 RepID=A0A1V4SDU1_RUMHU|nr:hypothetical protein [Ruminiclostridium hungatei]OPX42020.1 hypothetical protein CLHUN_40790 [Ruminiclostridium hungatei]
MADASFISADIDKIAQFQEKSAEAITEFDAIKTKFDEINATLLGKWKGEGADAYKAETDHILEKIGGIKDILDGINNGVVNDIKDNYLKLDEQLSEFNKNPQSAE